MRAIWKGAISFGLVSIPVKLYTATEERDVAFHQVHRTDGGRIRYRRVCSVDGEEVSYGDIAKGFELPSGEMVVLTDDDLADLPLSTSREVDVLAFVPLEQVDPIYFSKSYYLEPDGPAAKPYVLLRDALEKSGRVAIVKVAIRSREALATLRVRDGVLVMETMIWPDEVREPDFAFLDGDVTVRAQELSMAESLIESMTGDFAPEDYHDDYRAAVEAVVDAKVEGREVVAPVEKDTGGAEVLDLMAALRNSVADAKRRRGESVAADDAGDDDEPDSDSAAAPAKPRAAAKTRSGSGRAAKATDTTATGTKASGTNAGGTKATARKAAVAAKSTAKRAGPAKATAPRKAATKASGSSRAAKSARSGRTRTATSVRSKPRATTAKRARKSA
ncbi:MAG: Ku protein [Pseudonocardiales bacterium]|nr:MAG: Ku protein [Pseudonocardiales bacterium]